MATCLDMIENLKAINVKAVATEALQANADAYSDANQEQMMEGKRKDGKRIGDSTGNRGYYQSLTYARDKQRKNSRPGFMNPDLNLTGAFQDGMYMNVKGEDIIMDSTDSKTSALVSDYGDTIFGVGEEKAAGFVEDYLLPTFNGIIERQTGLKFAE